MSFFYFLKIKKYKPIESNAVATKHFKSCSKKTKRSKYESDTALQAI
jgi:hypothetical protein